MSAEPVFVGLERVINLAQMHMYGAATWDSHRFHYDQDYVAAKGVPAPIVDGQMIGALMATMVLQNVGPQWRLASLSYRFATFVYADQTVRLAGEYTSRTDDRIEMAMSAHLVEADGSLGAPIMRDVVAAAVRR